MSPQPESEVWGQDLGDCSLPAAWAEPRESHCRRSSLAHHQHQQWRPLAPVPAGREAIHHPEDTREHRVLPWGDERVQSLEAVSSFLQQSLPTAAGAPQLLLRGALPAQAGQGLGRHGTGSTVGAGDLEPGHAWCGERGQALWSSGQASWFWKLLRLLPGVLKGVKASCGSIWSRSLWPHLPLCPPGLGPRPSGCTEPAAFALLAMSR